MFVIAMNMQKKTKMFKNMTKWITSILEMKNVYNVSFEEQKLIYSTCIITNNQTTWSQ